MMDTEKFVKNVSGGSSDEELIATARHVAASNRIEDVCALAQVLARSGIALGDWGASSAADIASTGGPFSLSTLLCPLILAAAGYYVPKLGVPGRPAGGIDCMLQVPGYRAEFDEDELRRIVERTGYAHFLSGGRFAPLDARMFSLRQRHGLQSVARLATASILSKKLAVGICRVGLDVRVAPWGNFGADMDSAGVAADIFTDCARMLGLEAFVFLSDSTFPYQPYLGRSESLLAMAKVLDGSAEGLLAGHAADCLDMAATVIERNTVPTWSDARSVLAQHLNAQGTDIKHFESVAARTEAAHKHQIIASRPGYFAPNIPALRDALVKAQSAHKSAQPAVLFPDPIGLVLCAPAGEQVELEQPLASVRADDDIWDRFRGSIESAMVIRTC